MKAKDGKGETSSRVSEYEQMKKSLKDSLDRCLHMLKIGHYKDLTKKAIQHLENASPDEIKAFGNWIVCLNAVAESCLANNHILSQSETYDFLTVAVATNIEEKTRTKSIDDIIFRIYKDIMVNYESSDDKLKLAYPNIIVDVVAILTKGINIEGKKVVSYQVETYYQKRKLNATLMVVQPVTTARLKSATATSINTLDKKALVNEDDKDKIIESLGEITGRTKEELELSLSKIQRIDVVRLRYLCKNYDKLQKYWDLIHGSEEKFKVELQRDIGRQLSHHQLQRATNSIKQVKVYIENVLDGKFEPRGSYGINHVKHNLEYGYQLTGLIQSKRRSLHKK